MNIDWTPDRVKTLMALWSEGIPTLEIGRRLGVTKNAVVGKVHRLGLTKRQSPISAAPRAPREPRPEPVRLAPQAPIGRAISMEKLSHGMCSWPEGEPGTDHFHFCGLPSVEGKPYCDAHCQRAYVRVSKDRARKVVAA